MIIKEIVKMSMADLMLGAAPEAGPASHDTFTVPVCPTNNAVGGVCMLSCSDFPPLNCVSKSVRSVVCICEKLARTIDEVTFFNLVVLTVVEAVLTA